MGIAAGQVFKTLVVTRPAGKPILAMVPATCQLELKKVAKELSEKKVKMAGHKQAESMTGLKVGGISPLALLNRGFVVLIDRAAMELELICISGGRRGIQIRLPVKDLIQITEARLVNISD